MNCAYKSKEVVLADVNIWKEQLSMSQWNIRAGLSTEACKSLWEDNQHDHAVLYKPSAEP